MKSILFIAGLMLCLPCVAQNTEEKLQHLGIHLPENTKSLGNYVDVVRSGKLLFLAGKGPLLADGKYLTGKFGDGLSVDTGYSAARIVAIQHLAILKRELGNLSSVKRIVKVNGFVNSASDFTQQSKVIDGFSDLMVEVFGDAGKHARTAVGVNSLPLNMAVEIEMVVETE